MRRMVAIVTATVLLSTSLPARAQQSTADAATPAPATDAATPPSTTDAGTPADATGAGTLDSAAASPSPSGQTAGATASPCPDESIGAGPRASCAALPAPAEEAQSQFDSMFVWGVVAMEVFGAAAVVWRIGVDPDSEILPEALVLSAPLPLALPVAILAYLGRWDVRIPLAIHGGAWTGAVLGLAGALLDGARLGRGTSAETDALFFMLGATGAFVGAAFGATQIDADEEAERVVWLAAPAVAIGIQLVVSLVYLIATFGGDGSLETERFLGWSTFATGSLALGFAHVFVL